MTEMTYEELRCALEVATENRRVLAQAVLDWNEAFCSDDSEADNKEDRMISLAQELVK